MRSPAIAPRPLRRACAGATEASVLPIDRSPKTDLDEPLPDVSDPRRPNVERLRNCFVSPARTKPAFVDFQQDPRSCQLARRCFACANKPHERRALLLGEPNHVLLVHASPGTGDCPVHEAEHEHEHEHEHEPKRLVVSLTRLIGTLVRELMESSLKPH